MNKKKSGIIKLNILSGSATPSNNISPLLGQKGLNIINFCKEFNSKTFFIEPKIILAVKIIFYNDKSFIFYYKKPPVSFYIKDLLINKKNCLLDLKFILNLKIKDFNSLNLYFAYKSILGTLKSMNL